jgi:hypothetical protein
LISINSVHPAYSALIPHWQARKKLKFHPFSSLWASKDIPYHIRTWWEIMFKERLASAPHIGQDCLPEVPTQELINRSGRIVEELLIEIPTRNTLPITRKADDLVIIPNPLLATITLKEEGMYTSRLIETR